MKATFDKEQDLKFLNRESLQSYWNDSIFQNHYTDYYNRLSSKELDREFNENLTVLTKHLNKIPESQRKVFIDILSRYFELYFENKIEKEINDSLFEILKV
ncbi:MAG: hypothetical protein WC271_09395 [Bacteroidales bacterium]|jgi:hypothetical protein|nr:hypothetical protein [Bacteroidales bacterium]MDD3132759.1 hypothetical protein [Bacteroidales bacterium]MDD3526449.1 hypothetical protein [Bacteroidales bacterium]MDD4177504.1 hypothetical protein [Bacteroidales bacterium]MDD4741816.1 hypothetical protein [Bacteroidales bacterium]